MPTTPPMPATPPLPAPSLSQDDSPSAPQDPMADAALGGAAGMVALLVRRPVLAFVINALIVLAGIAALLGAEVRELPAVDRPVLTINTDFDGAAPETIDREVTGVIEGAAGRVPGVAKISSSSRFGASRVTVEFGDSTNLDVAANDMRDAIARVRNTLPDDADEPRVVKADGDAEAVMRLAVTSDLLSPQALTTLVEDRIEDRLMAAPGVADVQLWGGRAEVFRVDIDQQQMAARGLSLSDLRAALGDMAFDSPAGSLDSSGQSLVVRATASLTTEAAFEALQIKPYVKLGDVAQVMLGPDPGSSILRANGQPGIGLQIIQQAQGNTLEISRAVRGIVADLQRDLPGDVRLFITSDSADFINGAMHEVELALGLSVVIVTAIIWLFLRDARATLVPVIAIPVSLIGTLAAVWLVGFSINILTLLALVLATGMVVDDAIVVLENIVRRRAEGMGPRAAAVLGTQQVFFAVIATTTTLAAVFVPLSFLPGQTGGLFREFGFTMAISVLLSSVTALTLCPVMAARFLRGQDAHPQDKGLLAGLGGLFARAYARSLHGALNAPWAVVAVSVVLAMTGWMIFGTMKQELTPPEDRGAVILSVTAPQGVALDYTDAKMRDIEDQIAPLRDAGEVASVFAISGSGGRDNRGFMVLTLAPWAERGRDQQTIAADIQARLRDVIGLRVFLIQPNSLGIRGGGQGLGVSVVGPDYARLAEAGQRLVAAMEADGRFGQVRLDYDTTQPQLFVEVDRDRAADLGIDIAGLGEALQAVLDGRTVGSVFLGDRSHDVKMISTRNPIDDPGDLERLFIRGQDGTMLPMSSFVRLEERAVAPELGREDQSRAVPIAASLSADLPLGSAWLVARDLAAEVLPADMRLIPRGEAATLNETNAGLFITFGMAVVVVLLVLAAQFESFIAAVVVMATVPLGLACAIFAMVASGGSLNVYSQIGLVLLVGIMAKNGILIVEFANQLRDEGRDIRTAIEEAATVRLRPVMMTMVATVIGGVPLVLAKGAGAEAREVLGWIIVGGLGLATLATLYLTPVAFLLLARFTKPRVAEEARLRDELAAAQALAPRAAAR